MAKGDCLEHDVAGGSGFGGAGENRDLHGVGGELIQQVVVAAATDDVEALDSAAGEFFDLLQGAAVEEREAFEGATDESAFGFRCGLVGAPAELDDL